ncbi:uncharacterized protein LOC122072073 isoform X2 [Macadamia integrifolia]|uniref:uncharacterized protein LOC122072073 isoform X2 n=1 Tax=Macadamia integrifolia TaxID=60698 RepID=UPI001C4FE8C3|nr:uncharacterized protein LOC122072073 isoform X2 [Macadamia integrifolia]
MSPRKKLILNEKVEVRQFDVGLRGSWHPGVVVGVSDFCRLVMYNELLCETGDSKLVESIPITKAVEGLCHRRCHVTSTYRGRIRPQPSPSADSDTYRANFTCGLCVDAFYEDAWWEGVIFDRDEGAEVRLVFFPDEGDELKVNVKDLRVSRKWDELLGIWKDRGVWVLMELAEELEQERPLSPFLKKVWFHLRSNAGFVKKISEWTCGVRDLWSKYLREVLPKIAVECGQQTSRQCNLPLVLSGNKRKQLGNSQQTGVDFQLHCTYFLRSNSNGFHIGGSTQTRGKTPYGRRTQEEQSVDLKLESQEIHQAVGRGHWFSSSSSRNALTGDATLKERNQFVTKGRNLKTLQKDKDNMGLQALATGVGNCGSFPVYCSGHGSVLSEERQPLKLRLRSMKSQPFITCKTQDNKFVLDNSIQVKDMVDDAAFTGKNSIRKCNSNRFPVDCAVQSEVSESYAVPPEQKSDNRNLMNKKSKASVTDKPTIQGLMVDNLNRAREKENAGFLMPENVVEDNTNLSSTECFHQTEGKVSSVLPKHMRQSVKEKSSVRKFESLLIHEGKDNESGVHNSKGRDDLKAQASLLQESQRLYEQNRKIRYKTGSNGIIIPNCNQQKRKGKDSSVFTEKCNLRRGRSYLKKFQQVDGNMESQPYEDKRAFNAQTKHDEVVKHRRGPLHFCGYDKKVRLKDMVSRPQKRRRRYNHFHKSDTICAACQYGGILILCDSCHSSYHSGCVGLEDIPNGDWFCPSCQCGICGLGGSRTSDRSFSSSCYQCTSQYHVDCLSKREQPISGSPPKIFCSKNCIQIFGHLHQILGKSNPTSIEGLSWTMLRRGRNDSYFVEAQSKIDYQVKLSHAWKIMHECFHPIIEPRSRRNIVVDVLFNRVSKFRRLDFHGFYTMVLQKGDEVTCVATVRVHGPTVAEMPLIGTSFKYRKQGMCHVLVNELEKMLNQLGVKKLVLPAVPHLSQTWKNSFGFTEMSHEERLELLGFPLLGFQGTAMYQKYLAKSMATKNSKGFVGILKSSGMVSGFQQEKDNQVGNCKNKFCGFHYKRKERNAIIGKDNMFENGNRTKDVYKYVYKRQRILASKGLSTDQ